jgi:glycosyltransferase involved in cell wall biosynthesis
MNAPLVSVVVSTYQRPARLAMLLAGLRGQTLQRTAFEVIVVDNGSGPDTAAVLDAERARGELPLRTIRHERTLGPAGGRNSGWRAALGALVAFTDDDCVPDPGWLAAGIAAAGAQPGAIVQVADCDHHGPFAAVRDVQHLLPAGVARRARRVRRGVWAAAGRGGHRPRVARDRGR